MSRLATPAHLPVALLTPDTPSPWGSVAPASERLAAYRALLGRPEPAVILPQSSPLGTSRLSSVLGRWVRRAVGRA